MPIRLTPDDDEPDDLDLDAADAADASRADTPEEEQAALEEETTALHLVLGVACHRHHTRAVMAALSVTLQAVVAAMAHDLPEIDAYAAQFHQALRERWLINQSSGDTEH